MTPTFSSLFMAIAVAASAGSMLTACGSSDLATALPDVNSATLVTTTDSTSAVSEDLPPIVEDLDLTESQRQQAEQIRSDTQAQIRALLTPDQVALLDAFEGDDREAFRALKQDLNLTEAQREQIVEIVSGSREAFRDLLTPEQIATLENTLAELAPSETQQQQIQQIRATSREQIRALLTPEQIAVLESLPGSEPGAVLREELNLTETQRDQIKAIRQEARDQIKALLDVDQLESLEGIKERLENRKAQRPRIYNG